MSKNSLPLSVSVVIPSYNGKRLLKQHLPAVIEACAGAEIIVVDDASNDQSVAYLNTNFPQVKVIRNATNQRFAVSCNRGVAAASGEIIVLLNNDVSPAKDFLSPLLQHFTDAEVFAIGCKEVDDDGVVSGRSGMAFDRGLVRHWRCQNQDEVETAWVAGGSAAFRRSMWQTIGGMDPLYKPAYEEDRDISYQALKRGWKIFFEPKSVVAHHHETTNSQALGRSYMQIASHKNQLLFIWKNITDATLLGQHLAWLPYHLVISSLRTRGAFLLGFLWALTHLPQALLQRSGLPKPVVDDVQLFAQFHTT